MNDIVIEILKGMQKARADYARNHGKGTPTDAKIALTIARQLRKVYWLPRIER